MNQLELLQKISSYLSRFREQITILNSNGEFSINIHAENLLVSLLNEVYDLSLENVNKTESPTYAAIDLRDKVNKSAFQITATNSLEKIKHTIEQFFKTKLFQDTAKLKIFLLTGKQQSGYSQKKIIEAVEEQLKRIDKDDRKQIYELGFEFNAEEDILENKTIYNDLYEQNNLEKIIKVEKLLRQQFDKIEEQQNLTKYNQKLKNYFYDVVMDDEKGLTLNQIYVDPHFAILANAFKKEDTRVIKKNGKFLPVDDRYKLIEFIDDTLTGKNELNLAESSRLILILGYPGQGKSSFCKRLLNSYILNGKNKIKNIYYFTLRNIRQVRDFIFNPINTLYEEACLETEQELLRFEFYKSILILDGLDELYMREGLKLDEIDKLCKELAISIDKSPELQIIITSRYGYVDLEKIYKEKILIVQLEVLTVQFQKEWLEKYILFHPETWLTSEKLLVFNQQDKYKHLKELIEQPLLLHMIASISEEINESTNRAKIYSQLFTELIDRKYSKDGQLEIFKKIGKDDLRKLMREIAFAIFQTGNEYITKYELFKLSATQEFLQLLPEENLKESIKGIMISFYFKEVEKNKIDDDINDKSNYAIEFLHKSLREYLTAEKIFFTINTEFLDKKRSSGRYIIDDPKSAAGIIFELFHKEDLSIEVRSHLKEIIDNEKIEIKELLLTRLFVHFKHLLRNDFLFEYAFDQKYYPIDISLRCFYGFWYIVSRIGLNQNYLNDAEIQERLCNYLILLSNSGSMTVENLDFSFQIFGNNTLNNCVFESCTFNNTNFSNTDIYDSFFIGCHFEKVMFSFSQLQDIQFNYCIILNSIFLKVDLNKVKLYNVDLKNVAFEKSRIFQLKIFERDELKGGVSFNEISFLDSVMDNTTHSLLALDIYYPKIKDQNITIRSEDDEDVQPFNQAETNDVNVEELPINYKRVLTN